MWTFILFLKCKSNRMAQISPELEKQLEKLLDKEKTARINNDHFGSVTILKDIVHPSSFRSLSYTTLRLGKSLMSKLLFLWIEEDRERRLRFKWFNWRWLGFPRQMSLKEQNSLRLLETYVPKKYSFRYNLNNAGIICSMRVVDCKIERRWEWNPWGCKHPSIGSGRNLRFDG